MVRYGLKRSKIDILNIWFTLKMHFIGLYVIIWKCMVEAARSVDSCSNNAGVGRRGIVCLWWLALCFILPLICVVGVYILVCSVGKICRISACISYTVCHVGNGEATSSCDTTAVTVLHYKAIVTIWWEGLSVLILGGEHDSYIYCVSLRITLYMCTCTHDIIYTCLVRMFIVNQYKMCVGSSVVEVLREICSGKW
jgi:hypothetical protein